MAESRAPRRPLWLIVNHENGRMGVFTLRPNDDKEVLPVFSFREEAEMFLRLGTPEAGWQARETTAGEFISLLYGPCAGVNEVALDPLPVVDGEVIFDLAGSGREAFLRDFMGVSPAPNSMPWTRVTVNDALPESADGNGAPPRETEEEHEHTKNGAARRTRPEKIRDGTVLGVFDGDGRFAIPDYVMRDFGLDGRRRLRDVSDPASDPGADLSRERG